MNGTYLAALLLVFFVILAYLVLRYLRSGERRLEDTVAALREQLAEMRTRQAENQAESLHRQVQLFDQARQDLNSRLEGSLKAVNETLGRTQGNITLQLGQTGTVVGEIQKKLGTLEEAARRIREIGQDISSLQDILQAPKLRGNLGEFLLEDLLKQIFPAGNYEIKHSFQDGSQVDAVLRIGGQLVPVDAKFPLESFQRLAAAENEEEKKKYGREFVRSVKERINEIADKYIKPGEGTFDFAMMYIPAENVFYETMVRDSPGGRDFEIFRHALSRHVIPVSPNSFYAYLMALVFGLRGFKIEQRARAIRSELAGVQEAFAKFFQDYQLLGRHLENALGKYEHGRRRAERFFDRVKKVSGLESELNPDEECLPPGDGESLPPEAEKGDV